MTTSCVAIPFAQLHGLPYHTTWKGLEGHIMVDIIMLVVIEKQNLHTD